MALTGPTNSLTSPKTWSESSCCKERMAAVMSPTKSTSSSPWPRRLSNNLMRLLILSLLAVTACAQNFTVIAGAPTEKLDQPYGLGIGPDNALYFCEIGNHRISRLDLKTHKAFQPL